MNRTDSPKKQPVPFGVNGQREDLLPTTPAGDNTASYDLGFPPVTMILKAAGGLPPKGQDMNQVLFELSSLCRWMSTGAVNAFDSAFSSSIGGYPKGSILLSDDGSNIFISNSEANTSNPNSGGSGWVNLLAFMNGLKLGDYGVGGRLQGSAAGSSHVGGFMYEPFQANNLYPLSVALMQAAGPTATEWAQLAVSYGGAFRGFLGRQVFGGNPEISELYHDKRKPTAQDVGAQPADATLTSLSGKDAAGLRNVLGLGTTATRNVGTGSGQIPDMGSFTAGSSSNAFWYKFPNGMVLMGGNASAITGGAAGNAVFFPIPFPNACAAVNTSLVNPGLYGTGPVSFNVNVDSQSRFSVYTTNTASAMTIFWLAFGS
ncbi:phage tail protein [Klebsiella sp. Ap-873]|nr:phage tail protein [Klebsiella sp. Ap-873]